MDAHPESFTWNREVRKGPPSPEEKTNQHKIRWRLDFSASKPDDFPGFILRDSLRLSRLNGLNPVGLGSHRTGPAGMIPHGFPVNFLPS
jgi:hypothetical protein